MAGQRVSALGPVWCPLPTSGWPSFPARPKGRARTSLAIAKQMDAQPDFAEACQSGTLSAAQAAEIAAATEVNPNSTRRLIDLAGRSGLKGLRESCRQVVTAGRSAQDDEARRAALHRSRYLRTWTDGDGAGRLDARLTPEALARIPSLPAALPHPTVRDRPPGRPPRTP